MQQITKKILIWTFAIIGLALVGYIGLISFLIFSNSNSCGLDDGPFQAVLIKPIELTENAKRFNLSDQAVLILENRNDTLSPVLTLIEDGKVKWTLDTDTRNTKGYELTRISQIDNVNVSQDTDPIKLNFTGYWTYGAEAGSIEINRKNGGNNFCLSW